MTGLCISRRREEKAMTDALQQITESRSMDMLLQKEYDYKRPQRGDIRLGVVLSVDSERIVLDLGLKRDGIVSATDLQRLGQETIASIQVGDEVPAFILKPENRDGNIPVSLYRARREQDWLEAQKLLTDREVWEGEITDYNKGGLVVPFGKLRGFVPASQIDRFPRRLEPEEKQRRLAEIVGQRLPLRVIEVDRRRRRLIFSERAGRRIWRKKQRQRLLNELCEGDVVQGTVSTLRNFGAFIDLGGADGLAHISELSWGRVRHPREVVQLGDEVDVYVLRLDHERNRIGLSLKRLQPDPWTLVDEKYEVDQLAEGVVTNVVRFGAFIEIEPGLEGLLHVSEFADIAPRDPRDLVKEGDRLLVRIIRIQSWRRRMGLSLRQVSEAEWEAWAAKFERLAQEKETEADEDTEEDAAKLSGEDTAAYEKGEQSEASVEHTPTTEPEEAIAAAQITESGEDVTSASGSVEENIPGEQFIEEPDPVSEDLWASIVEEG
jgi:small subunit ribosomal protein S1